jgi:hypothetical protein
MIPASVYASASRLKKIIFLTGIFDSAITMMGADPFGPTGLEYVLAANEGAWREAAKQAGTTMPSETTREAIRDLFRRRVEIRVALSRIA